MTFRYKVSKTVQVKQFEPLTIEAEFTSEKAGNVASWQKLAEAVENFVHERLDKETKAFKMKKQSE